MHIVRQKIRWFKYYGACVPINVNSKAHAQSWNVTRTRASAKTSVKSLVSAEARSKRQIKAKQDAEPRLEPNSTLKKQFELTCGKNHQLNQIDIKSTWRGLIGAVLDWIHNHKHKWWILWCIFSSDSFCDDTSDQLRCRYPDAQFPSTSAHCSTSFFCGH